MRDEIRRINQLVAEGKLSPEDAADLIDAFYATERADDTPPPGEDQPTPPPPPGGSAKDPFRAIVDQIEKLTKEGAESVDWKEVTKQARESARKGFDFLKGGLEEISKGKFDILFGITESKNVTLPLTVGEGKALKIENACGDVKVTSGEPGTVVAHAKFRGSSIDEARNKAAQYTLIIEESEHQVLIRQPDVSGLSVDLEIKVAGKVPVEIRAESGDIEVKDTGAGCRINGKAGDIRLSGLNGQIEITAESGDISIDNSETSGLVVETKSGDIQLKSVRGNINIRTASGNLTAIACGGRTIAMESISGDVRVDLIEPMSGSLNVRTVNGDATIDIPDGSDCRVSLSTLRGDVSCEIDLQDEAKAQQRITGKLGEGTGTLDVSAVTGDVNLQLRNHEAAAV